MSTTPATRPAFPGHFLPGFVVSVEIGYSENPTVARQTGKGKKLTMEEAERILADGRKNFHGDIGCDKTDFILTFSDGDTYKGRYDLTPKEPSLAEHVFDWIAYLAFKAPDDIFARTKKEEADADRANCRKWLTIAFGV